jgi:hypothetical protein
MGQIPSSVQPNNPKPLNIRKIPFPTSRRGKKPKSPLSVKRGHPFLIFSPATFNSNKLVQSSNVN